MDRWQLPMAIVLVAASLLGAAPAMSAQPVTPLACSDEGEPPCWVEWSVPSEFVDPERALIHAGELNVVDGRFEDGGVARASHELKLTLHLPAGYDGERRFPVLYLLHGSGGNHSVWRLFHGAEPLLRELPAVAVMPEGGSNGFFTNWWDGGRSPEAQLAWERYHLEEVIPLVERQLKIRSGRRWRAIFGFSMGANGAIRYAAQCPDCFGSAGSLSGALDTQDPLLTLNCAGGTAADTAALGPRAARDPWCLDTWGNPVTDEFYWAGHNPIQLTPNLRDTRIYVAHGDGVEDDPQHVRSPCAFCEPEFAALSSRFVQRARADGVAVEYRPHGGYHSDLRATADLEDAIKRWDIFAPVNDSPRRWTFKTVSQHGRIWGIDYDFEQPPEDLIAFEREGDVLTGRGTGTVTIRPNDGRTFTVTLPFRVSLPNGRPVAP